MTYAPGDQIEVIRAHRSGRIGRITGRVLEDHGYVLVIRDDESDHRMYLAVSAEELAKVGITQTITVVAPPVA